MMFPTTDELGEIKKPLKRWEEADTEESSQYLGYYILLITPIIITCIYILTK